MRIPALALVACLALVPLARAVSVIPPTLVELVAESDTIIRGVVTDVRAEEFDSPQGRGIRTLVTVSVERTLKGSAGETVTLVQLGGTVGKRALRVAGLPEFKRGERQIVFIAGNGHMICPVIGGVFGRFKVQTDTATGRDHVFRNDGAPLLSIDQIPLPLSTRPLLGPVVAGMTGMVAAEFETRILAASAQLDRVNRAP
jgi:hypothetical protein